MNDYDRKKNKNKKLNIMKTENPEYFLNPASKNKWSCASPAVLMNVGSMNLVNDSLLSIGTNSKDFVLKLRFLTSLNWPRDGAEIQ